MLLLACRIADYDNRPLGARYRGRLTQMVEASRGLRHPDGRMPQFGDSDSGRVLPLDSSRRASHDHLIWLGAAVLGAERPFGSDPHPEVAWTLGLRTWDALRQRSVNAHPAPRE